MAQFSISREEWKNVLAAASGSSSLYIGEGSLLEQVDRMRKSPQYEPLIQEIREEAERLLEEQIPLLPWSKQRLFVDEGTRLPFEELYFARRRRLTALALMTVLEPDEEKYAESLLDTIWAICDEYSWCLPAHLPRREAETAYSLTDDSWMHADGGIWVDLFASETAFALAEISSLLFDRLPATVRKRVKYEVYRRVLYPYMNKGPFGWEEARHNWSAVCAGSIGSAAIYLVEDEDELAAILEKAVPSLGCFLLGFEADGACMEGIYYWGYGFGFYVYAADLIKKRTGGAVDLFADAKIREIAEFQAKCFLSGDKVVNFADSGSTGKVYIGLSHYLGRLFPGCEVPETRLRAALADDHCGRWAPAVRNLLWYDPDLQGKPWGEAAYWLNDAEWMISRHVSDDGVFGFAAKGGHNGEPHNHNDVGHFILHANGVSLLADMGWGMYSAQYFGKERYTFVCTSSEGHSLPIIDGKLQEAGAERGAKVLQASLGDEIDILKLELADAYAVAGLRSIVRRFEWRKNGKAPVLVLSDSYEFARTAGDSIESVPHRIVERFIGIARPDRVARNCYLIAGGSKSRVKVFFDAGRMEPSVSTLTMQDHHGRMVDYYALDFTFLVNESVYEAQFEFSFGE